MLPLLPKGIIVQFDFSQGPPLTIDGIRHTTGDYNITTLGPPESVCSVLQRRAEVRSEGFGENGARHQPGVHHGSVHSLLAAVARPLREAGPVRSGRHFCELAALWVHAFASGGDTDVVLVDGRPAVGATAGADGPARFRRRRRGACHRRLGTFHPRRFSSTPIPTPWRRYPGPIQKGPSQPLFLDPAIKNFGPCRAWQNDLAWTNPWGPELTARQFRRVEEEFQSGIADLKKAARSRRPGVSAGDRGRAARRGNHVPLRAHDTESDRVDSRPRRLCGREPPGARREELRKRLIAIGRDELANARAALAVAEADSRIGASSEGDGLQRGGAFTPALISTEDWNARRRVEAAVGRFISLEDCIGEEEEPCAIHRVRFPGASSWQPRLPRGAGLASDTDTSGCRCAKPDSPRQGDVNPLAVRSDKALIAITLDLEMSMNYPKWEDMEWNYMKGNLDEPTKRYAAGGVPAGQGQGRGDPLLSPRTNPGAGERRLAQGNHPRRASGGQPYLRPR